MHDHYSTGYTTTYTACHDHNKYMQPFTTPKELFIAGSAGWKMDKDCDLIINLDAVYKGLLSPPAPARPTVEASSEYWGELQQYEFQGEQKEEEKPKKNAEIIDVRWADFKVPNLTAAFWYALWQKVEKRIEEHPDQDYELLFTCQGGHGRTGTAMACFLAASGAYDPLTAIKWVRQYYCKSAVENRDQEKYLWYVGASILRSEGHEQAVIDKLKGEYDEWCDKNYSSKSTYTGSGFARGSSKPMRYNSKLNAWEDYDTADKEKSKDDYTGPLYM